MTDTPTKNQAGFTLLEMIIVLSIITISTYVLFTAFPIARVNQALQADITELRILITSAQQQALNEIRSQDCLDLVGPDEELARRCSNVGVYVQGQDVIQFADTTDDLRFTAGSDFILGERTQTSSLADGTSMTIVFQADPPTIVTHVNAEVLGAGQVHPFTLELEGAVRSLTVGPYGIIEYDDAEEE